MKKKLIFLTIPFLFLLFFLSIHVRKSEARLPPPQCTVNSDCSGSQYCNGGSCVDVPYSWCPYIITDPNRSYFSCNSDSSTGVGFVFSNHACYTQTKNAPWPYDQCAYWYNETPVNYPPPPGGDCNGSLCFYCIAGYNGASCGAWDTGCNTSTCQWNSGYGGPGGGGGGTTRTYDECETDPNFGACGYINANHGGPAMSQVTDNNGSYSCVDLNTPCDSQISGHVWIDTNGNGLQDNGEANVDSTLQTAISINGNAITNATTTDNLGNYAIGNSQGGAGYGQLTGGSYTITANAPQNYHITNTNPQNTTISFSNRNAQNVNFGIAPDTYTVSGTVYVDYNHNGSMDGNDAGYTGGVTIVATDSSGNVAATTTTDGSGNYTLTLNWGDIYTLSIQTVPNNYQQMNTISADLSGSNPTNLTNQNIGITPLYKIEGLIYIDGNGNKQYDASDVLFTQGSDMAITNVATGTKTIYPATAGKYDTTVTLLSGQYRIAYNTATTPLPNGYTFVNNVSTWSVTVGNPAGIPVCDPSANPNATCGPDNTLTPVPPTGSVTELDFGLTYNNPWTQGYCGDVRVDPGYSMQIPSTADCGGTSGPYAIVSGGSYCPNYPGILFSGSSNPIYGGGTGASTGNYVVGNTAFPETIDSTLYDSSYDFVMTTLNNASTPPTPLKNICPDLTNCTLSELTPGGVYTTVPGDGPVTVRVTNGVNTSLLGPTNYTFVIGNTLTFASDLTTQASYSAAFIAKGDIHVDGNVGETDWTSVNPDLQGFFSSDSNFDIDAINPANSQCLANGQPAEKKLNVKGAVITNAAGAGGQIVLHRDGCLQDLTCPAATFQQDPLSILHAPSPIKPPYTLWQELNP